MPAVPVSEEGAYRPPATPDSTPNVTAAVKEIRDMKGDSFLWESAGRLIESVFGKAPDSPSTLREDLPYPSANEGKEARAHGLGPASDIMNVVKDTSKVKGDEGLMKAVKESTPTKTDEYHQSKLEVARLASERHPLARLGYDETKLNIEPTGASRPHGYSGAYFPQSDQMYANFTRESGSSIVHESVHRGLEMLRSGSGGKAVPGVTDASKLDNILGKFGFRYSDHDKEELLVRHIMAKQMGNVEAGTEEQVAAAERMFATEHGKKALKELTELAAEAVKNKTPRGPR